MKLLTVLGFLAVFLFSADAAPQCHMSELMACVDITINWVHSLPKRSLPETEDDVNVMCGEIKKTTNCAFAFRDNCTTPLQRELISLIVEGALDLLKDFCDDGAATRTKYLQHASCLNKVSQMDVVKEQIEFVMAVLEKATHLELSQILRYACCGYAKVYKNIVSIGKEQCGQEAVDSALEVISVAIAQLPDILCTGFDGDTDECKGILPPEGSKPTDTAKELETYKFIHNILKNWLD